MEYDEVDFTVFPQQVLQITLGYDRPQRRKFDHFDFTPVYTWLRPDKIAGMCIKMI